MSTCWLAEKVDFSIVVDAEKLTFVSQPVVLLAKGSLWLYQGSSTKCGSPFLGFTKSSGEPYILGI